MHLIAGASFYLVGVVCIALGMIWLARGKARIFYGIHVEGTRARVASIFIIVIGILVFCFAAFVLPRLIPEDLFDVR